MFDGWNSGRGRFGRAAARGRSAPGAARHAEEPGRDDRHLHRQVDRALEASFTAEQLAALKIREKIRTLVWRRLEIMGPAREAVRRALAILAMPQNVPLALRISWRTADLMWRMAGDASTDFNHYTKRMTLGAVYGSILLAWLDDQSEGWADTAAFLDRRIDDVMKFEKLKAEWRGSSSGERLSLSRFLGRLRYPPR